MGNREINIKRQILSYFSKLDDVSISNLTVTELKEQFQSDIDIYDMEVSKEDEKVLNEFKNVYLKKHSDNGMFGKELEVFHIKSIEYECYNTDYEKEYKINGTRISFNGINTNVRKLSNNAHDLKSAKVLRGYIVITKKEYDRYIETQKSFQKQFDEIVSK